MQSRELTQNENAKIPFLRHDLFGLFAQYLPFEDLINLKKTCHLANKRGVTYEENTLIAPNLLITALAVMSRMRLGCFLQYYFRPNSTHEDKLAAIVSNEPDNLAALACYALVARRDNLELHLVNIALTHSYLLAKGFQAHCSLMQSIAFINHDSHELHSGIEHYSNAVFNLRGMDLSYWRLGGYDFSAANLREVKLNRARLGFAKLVKTDLRNAQLVKTKLRGAVLNGANLSNAMCFRIRLNGAELMNANLCGANLMWASVGKYSEEWHMDCDPHKHEPAAFTMAHYNKKTSFPLLFSPEKQGMIKIVAEKSQNNVHSCYR